MAAHILVVDDNELNLKLATRDSSARSCSLITETRAKNQPGA